MHDSSEKSPSRISLQGAALASGIVGKSEGKSNNQIAEELGINTRTVLLWVNKYKNRGEESTLSKLLSVSKGRGCKEDISGEAKAWLTLGFFFGKDVMAMGCGRSTLSYPCECHSESPVLRMARCSWCHGGNHQPRVCRNSRLK